MQMPRMTLFCSKSTSYECARVMRGALLNVDAFSV
jgi:hypothetical protein